MKLEALAWLALAVCIAACARATSGGVRQTAKPFEVLWKGDDQNFISALGEKQDASLARLAQQRATEAKPAQVSPPRRESVPPSMYRTTEPPLPEPDLSLPVSEVPRSTPGATPTPSPAVSPNVTPGMNAEQNPNPATAQ